MALAWSDHTISLTSLLQANSWSNATSYRAIDLRHSAIDMSRQEGQELLDVLRAPKLHRHGEPKKVYVEWGAGGSTELVAYLALSGLVEGGLRAYSIESSLGWMQVMRMRSGLVAAAEKAGHLKFIHGNIGPTVHLGYPAPGWNKSDIARTMRYVGLGQLGERAFDVVLDDGRFRVACALEALSYLRPSSVVLLHDFAVRKRGASPQRVAWYTQMLVDKGFFTVVRKNETLGVLAPGLEAENASAIAVTLRQALEFPE